MMGDFNEVLMSSEKFSGQPLNIRRAMKFQECLNLCGMMDMGFNGARYTWSNLRGVNELIQETLDRSFCNASWRHLYLEASVKHMTRINSNNCPILVEFESNTSLNLPRPFRFQLEWLAHPNFPNVVRKSWTNAESLNATVNEFTTLARKLNIEVFGKIFARKKKIEARLNGIQVAMSIKPSQFLVELEKSLRKDYAKIQKLEEEFWAIKSRVEWMVNGDCNTSFYHTSTLARRKRNRILTLQDSNGVWLTKVADVANHIREGFISLFTSGIEIGYRRPWNIPNWPMQISEEDAAELSCFVSDQEVKDALWSLKPFKAPGPDGLHAGFFQRFWLLVGDAITNTVKGAFTNGKIPEHIKKTLITLIPKHTEANRLGSFLPISLCNTIYKIITKIIVARLTPFLSNLISPMQVAFVISRKGLDNVIITQEIFHTMSRKKGNVG